MSCVARIACAGTEYDARCRDALVRTDTIEICRYDWKEDMTLIKTAHGESIRCSGNLLPEIAGMITDGAEWLRFCDRSLLPESTDFEKEA